MTGAAEPVAADTAAAPASNRSRGVGRLLIEYAICVVLVIVVVVATALNAGFIQASNLEAVLVQAAPVGIVAAGMTLVMIAGGFDLSVGALFAGGAVLYAGLSNHMPLVAAALLVMLVGAAGGVVNGLLVTRLRVNAFVATLGTGSVFGGAVYLGSNSTPVTANKESFLALGNNSILGVAAPIVVLVVALVLAGIVLARTVYGRSIYAIGGNDEAARLAGLRVDLIRGSTYVVSGVCAVIGGMILASRLGVGQGDLSGTVALDSIAIVVLGGTSLLGGEGAMWRTAVGLLVLATLNNVLDSYALNSNWQSVVKGGVLIAAVAFDALSRTRRSR
jgi:ribose transport system permease protein